MFNKDSEQVWERSGKWEGKTSGDADGSEVGIIFSLIHLTIPNGYTIDILH